MADVPTTTTQGGAVARPNKNPVVNMLKDVNVKSMLTERLGQRTGQFTTSLISLVNANEKIAECSPITVIQAALTAASLDLPINQNLAFAYIVPYRNKGKMEAQFQMGWKGFIQLAQRSGQFKYINSTDVRAGEIVERDRLSGEIKFAWIEDAAEREKAEVIGYVSYFELLNGFRSIFYMSVGEIDEHAKKYSQSFKAGFGPWKDNYAAMAKKTVTKLNLSQNAPLSTETQLSQAVQLDQSVQDDKGIRYQDNDMLEGELADDATKNDIINANKGTAESGK